VNLQSSQQEHPSQSDLASSIDLEFPDHGQWQAKNDKITNKGKHSIGHSDGDESIWNAISRLCLVPEVGYWSALKQVAQECGDSPRCRE
jgi:hypothetical protein